MNAVERRERLLQILALRGRSTFRALSEELGVSERTIMRDVDVLSTYKPVSVISGKHGGVFISDYSSFYNFSMKSYEIDLLQKYVFVSLDNFRKRSHNEIIKNELEAWLTFFATEEPGQIANLIAAYPDFRSLYADVYNICQNTERVMKMFSKELKK